MTTCKAHRSHCRKSTMCALQQYFRELLFEQAHRLSFFPTSHDVQLLMDLDVFNPSVERPSCPWSHIPNDGHGLTVRCSNRISLDRLITACSVCSDITITAEGLEARVERYVSGLLCDSHRYEAESVTERVLPAFVQYHKRLVANIWPPPGHQSFHDFYSRQVIEGIITDHLAKRRKTKDIKPLAAPKAARKPEAVTVKRKEVLASKQPKLEIPKVFENVDAEESYAYRSQELRRKCLDNSSIEVANEMKVAEMERKLAEKDRELQEQKRELDELKDKVQRSLIFSSRK
jgi:hypothetical protein